MSIRRWEVYIKDVDGEFQKVIFDCSFIRKLTVHSIEVDGIYVEFQGIIYLID